MNLSELVNGHRAIPIWAIVGPPAVVVLLTIFGIGKEATGFVAVLSWIGLGFVVLTALYLTLLMLGSAVASAGLKKAVRELSYIGYRREREWQRSKLTVTTTHVIPQALKPRGNVLAYFSYKLNSIFLSDTNFKLRIVPIEPLESLTQVSQAGDYPDTVVGSKVPYTAQSDFKLNHDLYFCFNIAKKLHETQQVEELPSSAHSLASYVFMELYSGVKPQDVDVDKVAFFYRNDYGLENSYSLREFSGQALLSFEDLPLSWVMQALVGEENRKIAKSS